ncbi:MAG: polyphosphate kinase 2 family protein [Alphaproteobacteria bacterium]
MKAEEGARLVELTRVTDGAGFVLADRDPADKLGLNGGKKAVQAMLAAGIARLAEMQDKLYALNRWSVLTVFQAMDAGGKDSAIKHVMSGVNPQGCQVFSFKAPSDEELDHDFLWRCLRRLPERGRIGIFNRSYYEEVLVVRVHPELLDRQRLPDGLIGGGIWAERFEDIRAMERYLARNGTAIVKLFLNVSKEEQLRRFCDRLERPDKHWKFDPSDLESRGEWDRYMAAYEDMIRNTATPHAPWYVIPADDKWVCRAAVAAALIATMEPLGLRYPPVTPAQAKAIEAARRTLHKQGS